MQTTTHDCCASQCVWRDCKGGKRWRGSGCPEPRRPVRSSESDLGDVCRLESLGALADFELHLVVLLQRLEAFGLDGGVMHEHVRSALTLDEPEALRVVEPLDPAGDT